MTDLSTTNVRQSPRPSRSRHPGFDLLALAIALAVAVPGQVAAGQPGACPKAGRTVVMQGNLPRFPARLNQKRSLKIVAIGSSSTAGAGASSPANSYPDRLEADLARRFPDHIVDVVNAGANGQEIPDMLARLDRDVLAHHPDLVIWQFGSNGLLRGRPLAEMEAGARIGIERIKATGAEVVLMDLQHAPRIDSVPARDEILAMMERLGRSTGAAVFHRYRLMKSWAASLGVGYSRMVHADQLHMTDASYYCMAAALAASLHRAADRRSPAPRTGSNLAAAVRLPSPPARAASAP
jgi:acyl-CoA thioesterase I